MRPLGESRYLCFRFLARCCCTAGMAAFLILWPLSVEKSLAGSFTPEQVKAAMLIKFTDFITWPEKAFDRSPDTFVIGILGSPKMFRLMAPLKGKKIQGRSLSVVQLKRWDPGQPVHLLYLGKSGTGLDPPPEGGTGSKATLTVSDSEEFLKAGGILSFITGENGRIGFAVNRTAQIRSGLVFSSSLLKLAQIRYYGYGVEK